MLINICTDQSFMLELRKYIIRKLYRRGCWNEKHTAFENTYSGVPSHLRGEAKEAVIELIKEDLIMGKQTCYGLQISLNPEKIKEIEECLG
jgi:hypothetical protein